MIPKIELNNDKQFFTHQEVAEMLEAIQNATEDMLRVQVREYKFAKRISYLSLILSILIIGKELFNL